MTKSEILGVLCETWLQERENYIVTSGWLNLWAIELRRAAAVLLEEPSAVAAIELIKTLKIPTVDQIEAAVLAKQKAQDTTRDIAQRLADMGLRLEANE